MGGIIRNVGLNLLQRPKNNLSIYSFVTLTALLQTFPRLILSLVLAFKFKIHDILHFVSLTVFATFLIFALVLKLKDCNLKPIIDLVFRSLTLAYFVIFYQFYVLILPLLYWRIFIPWTRKKAEHFPLYLIDSDATKRHFPVSAETKISARRVFVLVETI